MARNESILSGLKWDLALLGLIAVLAAGYALVSTPRFRPATSETTTGSRPPDRTEGDVLLLFHDTPAAEAKAFDELDCSYGWFNALWQEYGSFATALTRDLSPEILAGRSVVIVPLRVARAMPATGIEALAGFVREGGQLVVEQPPESWRALTGLVTDDKERPARQLTSVEGLGVHGPMREHLPDVPLAGNLMIAPPMDHYPAGPVLLEADGQPGLTVQPLGEGRVYTFLFNFGCTVTGIQQGVPAEAMRFGLGEPLLPTASRVARPTMLQAAVPYADLLERALFGALSEQRPLPKLWSFPGTHAGALMMTHPTATMPRAALGYADAARRRDAASTIFVAPDQLNPAQAGIAAQAHAEVGLLWVRGTSRPPVSEPVGVGAIEPLARELSLTEQYARLDAVLREDQPLRLARVEDTMWTTDWSTTFEQLAAAKLRLDTSFGPTGAEQWGYLFGTGFPYYPIDARGLPLPMLELPSVLHGAGISRSRLENLLENSHAYFHQSLVVSLPSDAMRRAPAPGILLAFRDAFELGLEYEHWVTTVGDFLDFVSARRRSILTSQWSEASRRLTISVNLLGARVPTMEEGAIPGIAFPRTYEGQEVERVLLDDEEIPLRALTTSGSSADHILTVGPGRHTVSVFYAAPVIEEADEDEK